ncbi:LacI family DNA-binding transcriptional regulator [Bifidobacterium platyrrhinorum]|uniref:LacI family DNA-binding transcriptional regulator n=1 Tax=Bifidobacterium platyrrhinorum TaxID=2661628 RepID=A0A6L9SRX3_9BIFI|nr:LacI family DNA-binding transcriptional regulator [Bifidobacterium platyrrhinorum]NEG55218.1 LacI family DNA-binding transcriptional regulator [Bifidobacterium platyrrhinorum]
MSSSIQDVAKAAGVSISTVSRSFTRPDLVSAKTRERVLAIADQLNFSLSRSAAALKSGRSLRIAVLMSGHIRLWFTASVIEGLNEVLHAEGYDISIFQISSIEERREFFEMLPVRRNADAVIVVSFDIDAAETAQLASMDVPIIGINCADSEQHGFAAAVTIDDAQGSTLAARHLITLGHRDIAYITTNRDVSLSFSVRGRFDMFMDCCRKEGIEPQVVECKVDDAGHYQIGDVVTQLMSLDVMPTAIACQEDGIALPLMFQLERNGFSVPRDVSVIGYDDSFYADDIGLTTIRQDPVETARIAARMTLGLINRKPLERPFRTLSAQLVVRSSSGRR